MRTNCREGPHGLATQLEKEAIMPRSAFALDPEFMDLSSSSDPTGWARKPEERNPLRSIGCGGSSLGEILPTDLAEAPPPYLPPETLRDIIFRSESGSREGQEAEAALRRQGITGWREGKAVIIPFPEGSEEAERKTAVIKLPPDVKRRKRNTPWAPRF